MCSPNGYSSLSSVRMSGAGVGGSPLCTGVVLHETIVAIRMMINAVNFRL